MKRARQFEQKTRDATRGNIGLWATLALVGCTTTGAVRGQEASAPTGAAERGACALGIHGASAFVQDTREGVAIHIVSAGHEAELLARANDAAACYGTGARHGHGHMGHHGQGGKHGLQPMQMPPASAKVTEEPDGVRLEFVPYDATDLQKLRDRMRERARSMNVCEA